ncbi:MAG: UDP-N-acetylglucosamine 1-carboxyvinyltransferase [Oscillospiraceae bacterium]|nr:UDP-N-acetylglucosamine 1-carboxyvinyltransferase [Oscillospiraceae bacterium]
MGQYEIIGGSPLRGEIRIHGAKNSVLPILAATLLCESCCVIEDCPYIRDVDTAVEILEHLGCRVQRRGSELTVDSTAANRWEIPPQLMGKMRGAILFLGALLSRFSQARLSQPGGCPLGDRPIDLHLGGLGHMGARCQFRDSVLYCQVDRFCPSTVALPFPSVGATENLLLAALSCPGETVICNAAREPEIADLMGFLRACGAELRGDGSSVLRIRGGKKLRGCRYRLMPDRMEAATYLAAAAATRGELLLKNVRPEHLRAVTNVLQEAGCRIWEGSGELSLHCHSLRGVSPIRTAPYDGFPTDAQAPVMAAMATAEGTTVFEETVFSDRMGHIPALCAMGAKISAAKRCAVVQGVPRLKPARACATDLRGGAALAIAMLAAPGRSILRDAGHICRGYERFDAILRTCGAQIQYTEGL